MGMGALLLSIALNKQLLLFSEIAQCLFIFQSFHKLPVSSRLLMQLKLCLLTLSNLIWFAFICNTSFVTLNHKGIVCSTVLSLLAQGYTGKNEYIAAQGEGFSSIQLLLLPQSRRKFEHKQWIERSLYLQYYWFFYIWHLLLHVAIEVLTWVLAVYLLKFSQHYFTSIDNEPSIYFIVCVSTSACCHDVYYASYPFSQFS